jgi:hypothetical protein
MLQVMFSTFGPSQARLLLTLYFFMVFSFRALSGGRLFLNFWE